MSRCTCPHWPLTSEIRHNTFLAFKESLNNVVKHARASEVRMSLELEQGGFTLVDGGQWLRVRLGPAESPARCRRRRFAPGSGNGLANMRKRLDEIGGAFGWDTAPGEGTRAKLVVSVKA